jgi:hypothetical protein
MILGFKHLLKHNMVKTQGKAPAGGEAEQTRITTTEILSYRNLPQSCFKIRLYQTLGKLIFLFKSGVCFSLFNYDKRGFLPFAKG